MNSINVNNLQNVGPFMDDISINFVGYLNGTIKIIDNDGKQLAKSNEFDHETVDITISNIPKNKQFSAIVEAETDPSFHGTYSSSISGQNSISSNDITDVQRGRYASVRISMIDQDGTSSVIHNASINSAFNISLQNGIIYVYELLCRFESGGSGSEASTRNALLASLPEDLR